MSHFVTVKTKIKDLNMLDAAAKALGLKRVERNQVRGWRGKETFANAVWQVNHRYDVGAVKSADGTYDLVADWWGTVQTVPDLQTKLSVEYGVQVVLRRARLMGHQVERQPQKDGSVRLVIKTS